MSDDKKKPESETKATFRGETVEPRILLSVTWIAAGTAGNDTILGSLGNDGIDGGAGNDLLSGLTGDDVLRGGAGDDVLDGGLGTDTADYSTATGGVTVSLTSNTASGAAGNDTLSGIESVMGSSFDDTLTDGLLNETLTGGGGNDTFVVGLGNDTVDGGAGTDTVSYAGSLGPVAVDLTHAGPQNTGLAGVDTLSNVEGVIGTTLGDTFTFTNPADGITYSVDGGGGADVIDLSRFASSAVSFSNGHFVVDLGGGQSFAIDHANVETIRFADVRATVVTSNLGVGSFSSSGIFLDGDQAFRLDVNGPGSLDWGYDAATDTLTIADANSTDATTRVAITDLNGTDLHVGTIALDRQLGSLISNVDVDGIQITSGNNSITTITIGGGTGTLGSFSSSGSLDTATTIHANIGSIDVVDVKAGLAVDGDVGSLALAGELADTGVLHVQGDIGDLSMDRVRGVIKVVGDVGSLTTAAIENDVTIGGDLDTAVLDSVAPGSHVTVENTLGTLDFHVGGVQHGATFAVPTRFVFDGTTQTATATTSASDLDPIADAGVDQSVNEGDLVSLNGLASVDPEGKGLTYTWVQVSGPPVKLSDENAVKPTFTAPEGLTDVDVQFALTVNDGVNRSVKDVVTVTIHADNDAPSANAGLDQTVSEGSVVTLTGLASSDPEAQGLTHTWVQTAGPAVALSDATAAQPTFVAPEGLTNTAVQFSLTVSDGTNTSSIDTVTVNINADNDAPSANAGLDQTVSEGAVVTLTGLASADPEAQGLTYTWVQTAGPAVTLSDANAAQPTFTAPEGLANTAVQFSLTVSDGTNTSSIDTVTVTVNADDDAPSANAGLDQAAAAGATVQLQATAVDPEGQALVYTWRQVGGTPVTLSDPNAANPTFVAPNGASDTLVFAVDVSDGATTTTDTVSIAVGASAPPAVQAQGPSSLGAGDLGTLVAVATDPEGDTLGYRWTQLSGPIVDLLNADQASASFLAPATSQRTDLVFEVAVTDGRSTTTQVVYVTAEATGAAARSEEPAAAADSVPVLAVATPPATTPGGASDDASGGASTQGAGDLETETASGSAVRSHGTASATPSNEGKVQADDVQVSWSQAATTPAGAGATSRTDGTGEPGAGREDARSEQAAEQALLASPSGQPDLVVADAGSQVELATSLPPPTGAAKYVWTQVGGTTVALDELPGGKLRVHLPEVFTEEELVFQVALQAGTEQMVQEITIQVQPVAMTGRQQVADAAAAVADTDPIAGVDDEPGHGLGRIWAAVTAFLGAKPRRREP